MSLPVRILRGASRLSRVWILGALVSSGLAACERFTGAAEADCPKGSSCVEELGGGGVRAEASGGSWAVGGAPNEGGQVGQQAGSGWGGEQVALGGAPNAVAPAVVEVRVGGRKVPADGSLLGVRSDAAIELEFNVDMDMETVIYAYSSENPPIAADGVTFDHVDPRHITILPSSPLLYPDLEEAASAAFTFTLSSDAHSSAGLPLPLFAASFEVLKRAHQLWPLDLKRSSGSVEPGVRPVKSGFNEEPNCPMREYPPEFLDFGPTSEAKSPAGLVGNGSDGSVAIYSYGMDPLVQAEQVEEAVLTLGKWPYVHWEADIAIYSTRIGEMDRLPFWVSELTDAPLNANRGTEDPLQVLKTTANESSETGFGLFEFDAAASLREALSRGDRGVAFRLEFDRQDYGDPLQTCASLLLDVTYLVE